MTSVEAWVSPLVEVERAAQERAKAISLDPAAEGGRERLRSLIQDEVARWSEDYKRGLRDFDLADPATVAERAFRNLAGYGPLEPLLADDDVWEIMINGPDAIFVRRHRGQSGYHDELFHDDDHVVRTLTRILDGASGSHRKLDAAEGLQDAQLESGARLHIVHSDVARDGHGGGRLRVQGGRKTCPMTRGFVTKVLVQHNLCRISQIPKASGTEQTDA